MAQTNLIGKTILGYTVGEVLGSGAFGTVYKVVKTNVSGQYVRALKHITIPSEKQYQSVLNSMGGDVSKADDYFSAMLQQIVSEITVLNQLSEKDVSHIVRYYENDICTSEAPKRYDVYILMEYLSPLEEFIQSEDFRVRDVVKMGLDILSALRSCHDNGIIHRDVKDANIFVTSDHHYKIGDFGVAKILKGSTKAESLKGTPSFLAPEVYLGKEGYTKSVDLYSLGMVLYRLLNHSRNPFLPPYPKEYYPEDEDAAFQERMSGHTPLPPSLGGEAIGRVILRAISRQEERYQSAQEFSDALEEAMAKTPPELLEEPIKLPGIPPALQGQTATLSAQNSPGSSAETIGESFLPTGEHTGADRQEEAQRREINQHLFDTVGPVTHLTPPPVELPGSQRQTPTALGLGEEPANRKGKHRAPDPPTRTKGPDEPSAIDPKVVRPFVFLAPVILLFIGVAAYFVILPKQYGKVVSLVQWLFSDPQNIMETLSEPQAVLPHLYSIWGTRVFWWIWLAALAASLFWVGKQLHAKPEPTAEHALLTKKEAYVLILDVGAALKQRKTQTGGKQWDGLLASVKRLEEKLSVESDFGYGTEAVIACENQIAQQLQFLLDCSGKLDSDDSAAVMQSMELAIQTIHSLLRKRTELKKHVR